MRYIASHFVGGDVRSYFADTFSKVEDNVVSYNGADQRKSEAILSFPSFDFTLMEDFNKPKIMYSEIVREARFFLDEHGSFYPEATTFILTGKYIHYLISALNTKLFEYVFKTFYAGGGLGEEEFRYKKQFVLNLPIPLPQQDETSKERHFMKVLGLTSEECKVIGIIWI